MLVFSVINLEEIVEEIERRGKRFVGMMRRSAYSCLTTALVRDSSAIKFVSWKLESFSLI